MTTTYELYGGPLDGAVVTLPRKVKKGGSLEMSLVRKDYVPDLGDSISRPAGKAIYSPIKGRMTFVRITPSEIK